MHLNFLTYYCLQDSLEFSPPWIHSHYYHITDTCNPYAKDEMLLLETCGSEVSSFVVRIFLGNIIITTTRCFIMVARNIFSLSENSFRYIYNELLCCDMIESLLKPNMCRKFARNKFLNPLW